MKAPVGTPTRLTCELGQVWKEAAVASNVFVWKLLAGCPSLYLIPITIVSGSYLITVGIE